MGRPPGWAARATGRPAMRSPGRPPVAGREDRQRFWAAIARGVSSEDAAAEAGVSPAVGTRWFRDGGGMPTISQAPLSGRCLSFPEREEIAILNGRGCGVREIARRLGRNPSTISRELRRNAATRGGCLDYRATTAQWHADLRSRRPKLAKLAAHEPLHGYVQERLSGAVTRPDGTRVDGPTVRWIGRRHGRRQDRRWANAWSPEQIAKRLPVDFPDDESMRISHEAIYQALYVQGRGALRRELSACLRTGRALRPASPHEAGQGLRHRRSDDQRAARGGRRPRRSGALGRRPHPRPAQLGDRHPRRAHHPVHDPAAPAAAARPWRGESQERPAARRARRRGPPGRDHCSDHDTAGTAAPVADLGPGRRDGQARWPSTSSCASPPDCRSTSVTRTAPGSAAATRTPTGCCAGAFRRAPTSPATAATTSTPSPPLSTDAPARPSTGRHPPRLSPSYCPTRRIAQVLRRPLEPAQYTSAAFAAACAERGVARSPGGTGSCLV